MSSNNGSRKWYRLPAPGSGVAGKPDLAGKPIEITFGTPVNKVYPSFTMAADKVLFRYNVHNKGLDLTDEFTLNDTTGARKWATDFPFRLLERSGATAADIEALGTDLVAFVVTKHGKVMVAGSDSGLHLKANTSGFQEDTFGESVTLGNDEGTKPYQYLLTDLPTSIAALVAAETA